MKIIKKLLTIIIILGMTTFLACGPSAKEKAEKDKQNSLRFTKKSAIDILSEYCNKNWIRRPGEMTNGVGFGSCGGEYYFFYNWLKIYEKDISITSFIKENSAEVEFIITDDRSPSDKKTQIRQKINFSFDGVKWKIIEDDNSKNFLLVFLGY